MKFTILIPHYKSGKATAYAISKLLEYKGKHEIEIFVIDNGNGVGSEYLKPFAKNMKYQMYPSDRLQSHGIAFDFVLPYVKTDWFITMESDSFPTQDNWLDYYEKLINEGYDGAASVLKLSGGIYGHPCGSLYRKEIWQEAKWYCNNVRYAYFPNMSLKHGFACHLMVHESIVEQVMKAPYDFIEPADDYIDLDREGFLKKMMHYSPVVAPFHSGLGMNDESVKTYGQRNEESEVPNILLDNKRKLINRVGYEPGAWLYYYQLAKGKKIFSIPTEVKWLPNKENQQQEYTRMENGFTHIWAGSSYLDMKGTDANDVYEFKHNQIESLYNSLPEHQKINQ